MQIQFNARFAAAARLAGQFFTTFRHDIHVIDDFHGPRTRQCFAALD